MTAAGDLATDAQSMAVSRILDGLNGQLVNCGARAERTSAHDGTIILDTDAAGVAALRAYAGTVNEAPDGPVMLVSDGAAPQCAVFDPDLSQVGARWVRLQTRLEGEAPAPASRTAAGAFFTVMGPEGVGKTTTCGLVEDIFAGFPLQMRQFHHTAFWKGDGNADLEDGTGAVSRHREAEPEATQTAGAAPRGLPYRLARTIWRRGVPAALKTQILAVPGELQYYRRISRLLESARQAGEIALIDRYCYDRYVRWQNLAKPASQRFMARLQCRFMRRPVMAFLLHDEPTRIHARKPVMPLDEIERHQPMLVDTCRRYRVPHAVVALDGRDAPAVAADIARRILLALGPRVFDLMDTRGSGA